jgi:phospholipid/cholesterol/gamma-HCH transport system ATP-binding protein
MGMLFQFGALFTDLSVFDNVAFQMREHTDLPESMINDLVMMKLHAWACAAHIASCRPSSQAAWRGASRSHAQPPRSDAHHV